MELSSLPRLTACCLFAVGLLAGSPPLGAQDAPAAGDLVRVEDGKAYEHRPSRSRFLLPAGWEVLPPKAIARTSYLVVRQGARNPGDLTVDLVISWSPLTVELKDVIDAVPRQVSVPNTDGKSQRQTYGLEHDLLQMLYGQDKVGRPDAITVNERPGFKVLIDSGPSLNDKEAGVVYIFETGPDERERWKVKLRATFPKYHREEALRLVEELVRNLRW